MSLSQLKGVLYNSSVSTKLYNILTALLILAVMYVVLALLLPSVNSPQIRTFTESLGIIGPIVVIFYTLISHIFAPIAGTPGILLGITLFGYFNTLISVYIASVLSSAINFQISRKYGRKRVKKLVGEKSLKEIDKLAQLEGINILIIARLIGFPLFEVVSYAFGLTTMRFKTYMLINIFVNPVRLIAQFYIFRNVDFSSAAGVMIWLSSLIIVGGIFTYYISLKLKNSKS